MKASSNNLLSIIKGPRQFVIPIYQRTYSWQLVQCNQLLNDILRISNDSAVQGHFIGSIVYFQESIHTVSDVPKLLVIDGQQRLTTVSLLIAAIADFIKENAVEIDTSFTKLQNYYLINPEEDNELRYKLLLTRRDKDTYINLLKGIPRSEGMSQRIIENYDFFKSKINKENVVAIYSGVQRLFVVDVALEKEKDNPQLIFESMNSTGLDLSQADLIRNYVLMGQEVRLQTSLYESYWYPMEQGYGSEYAALFNSFMRDYLSVKTGTIPRIDMVYDAFKAYVIGGKAPDTISEVVKDIYTYSGYYVNMVLHKEPDKLLCGAFKRISQLRVDVSYPFLLPLYNDYVNEVISRDEFYEALCLVENYVFRRAICGIPTNSLNKTFATLYKSFDKANYMDGLKAAFLLLDSYKRFPNDTEFTTFLQTKDVYNFRNRNYLLNRLENFQRKEMVNISDYTIEHVMPQNPNLSHEWQEMLGEGWVEVQGKYLHTLGNLTLTGYNSDKAHEGIPPGGGGHFLYRQLVQQLAAGRGLLAFGLVGGEALDEQLQFLDLFLVFPVLVLHHPLDHLAGLVPELIVAHIHLDMAVVHVHDVGADGVQEVTVMAHHKDQALAIHQEILKPLDGLNVQMVGGLVQQDDVRLAEQRLGQQHLHLFLGGQAGHFAVQNIVGEAKALNEPGHVGFGLPAAHFGKFGLQLAGLHAVLVGEVLFFIEGVLLLHHVIEALVAHHHRIQHGVGVILEVVLL